LKKKTELGALQKLEKQKNREQARVDKLSGTLASQEKERNVVEERLTSTKPLEELKEQETELIRQNEEDRVVINDENATPSEREAAEARVA